ncbi:hypothetical protein JI666_03555 [Bacillus sp. NTK071]|uniref:hypothetical protein n=1 Tax=Bacillus sp. NTK071 TaxID=2802175 RepID=UPI001A8E0ABA|nr:hypothetical protein [Bacillus sp. NTK071]MBN8207820.1 hypothetical protein [Bacillus sp. NTK071]
MNMLRGTLLSVLLLCFVVAVGTAFANEQNDDLAHVTGEVQKKMIRYEKPQMTIKIDQKDESNEEDGNDQTNENAEELTEFAADKPYYYLVVNKTPYLTDRSKWESIHEGDTITIGYKAGNVDVVKTIDEK